ncbi:hypothetical protein DDZ16_02315 [Marinilabilia rubra]|uniref:Uncharacterized protein n=1 Tax=Marinilabilia rubra TaxID=2162893 RepID=A0A2U2BE43_9BACT|nr:hypothetical protein DDZ16_02315 [Marinilabilia rubra]
MFLVGITGSLLPFLFLLGVVFVFSMQTSTQSLDDALCFDDHKAQNHHIYNPSVFESDCETDFHFTKACSDSFDCKKDHLSGVHPPMQCCLEAANLRIIVRMPDPVVNESQYLNCFSGLSPPFWC